MSDNCDNSGNNSGNLGVGPGVPDPNVEPVIKPENNMPERVAQKSTDEFVSPADRESKRYRPLGSFSSTPGKIAIEPEMPGDRANKGAETIESPVEVSEKGAMDIGDTSTRPNKSNNEIPIGASATAKDSDEIDDASESSAKDIQEIATTTRPEFKVGDTIIPTSNRAVKTSSIEITTNRQKKDMTEVSNETNRGKKESIETVQEPTGENLKKDVEVAPSYTKNPKSENSIDANVAFSSPKDLSEFAVSVSSNNDSKSETELSIDAAGDLLKSGSELSIDAAGTSTKSEIEVNDSSSTNKGETELNINSNNIAIKDEVEVSDSSSTNKDETELGIDVAGEAVKNEVEVSDSSSTSKGEIELDDASTGDIKSELEIDDSSSTNKGEVEIDDASTGDIKSELEIDDSSSTKKGEVEIDDSSHTEKGELEIDDTSATKKGEVEIDDSSHTEKGELEIDDSSSTEKSEVEIDDSSSVEKGEVEVTEIERENEKGEVEVEDTDTRTSKPLNNEIDNVSPSIVNDDITTSVSDVEDSEKSTLSYDIATPADGQKLEKNYDAYSVNRNKDIADEDSAQNGDGDTDTGKNVNYVDEESSFVDENNVRVIKGSGNNVTANDSYGFKSGSGDEEINQEIMNTDITEHEGDVLSGDTVTNNTNRNISYDSISSTRDNYSTATYEYEGNDPGQEGVSKNESVAHDDSSNGLVDYTGEVIGARNEDNNEGVKSDSTDSIEYIGEKTRQDSPVTALVGGEDVVNGSNVNYDNTSDLSSRVVKKDGSVGGEDYTEIDYNNYIKEHDGFTESSDDHEIIDTKGTDGIISGDAPTQETSNTNYDDIIGSRNEDNNEGVKSDSTDSIEFLDEETRQDSPVTATVDGEDVTNNASNPDYLNSVHERNVKKEESGNDVDFDGYVQEPEGFTKSTDEHAINSVDATGTTDKDTTTNPQQTAHVNYDGIASIRDNKLDGNNLVEGTTPTDINHTNYISEADGYTDTDGGKTTITNVESQNSLPETTGVKQETSNTNYNSLIGNRDNKLDGDSLVEDTDPSNITGADYVKEAEGFNKSTDIHSITNADTNKELVLDDTVIPKQETSNTNYNNLVGNRYPTIGDTDTAGSAFDDAKAELRRLKKEGASDEEMEVAQAAKQAAKAAKNQAISEDSDRNDASTITVDERFGKKNMSTSPSDNTNLEGHQVSTGTTANPDYNTTVGEDSYLKSISDRDNKIDATRLDDENEFSNIIRSDYDSEIKGGYTEDITTTEVDNVVSKTSTPIDRPSLQEGTNINYYSKDADGEIVEDNLLNNRNNPLGSTQAENADVIAAQTILDSALISANGDKALIKSAQATYDSAIEGLANIDRANQNTITKDERFGVKSAASTASQNINLAERQADGTSGTNQDYNATDEDGVEYIESISDRNNKIDATKRNVNNDITNIIRSDYDSEIKGGYTEEFATDEVTNIVAKTSEDIASPTLQEGTNINYYDKDSNGNILEDNLTNNRNNPLGSTQETNADVIAAQTILDAVRETDGVTPEAIAAAKDAYDSAIAGLIVADRTDQTTITKDERFGVKSAASTASQNTNLTERQSDGTSGTNQDYNALVGGEEYIDTISNRDLTISATDSDGGRLSATKLDGTSGDSVDFDDYNSSVAVYNEDEEDDITDRLSTINIKGEDRPTGQEHTNFNYSTATGDDDTEYLNTISNRDTVNIPTGNSLGVKTDASTPSTNASIETIGIDNDTPAITVTGEGGVQVDNNPINQSYDGTIGIDSLKSRDNKIDATKRNSDSEFADIIRSDYDSEIKGGYSDVDGTDEVNNVVAKTTSDIVNPALQEGTNINYYEKGADGEIVEDNLINSRSDDERLGVKLDTSTASNNTDIETSQTDGTSGTNQDYNIDTIKVRSTESQILTDAKAAKAIAQEAVTANDTEATQSALTSASELVTRLEAAAVSLRTGKKNESTKISSTTIGTTSQSDPVTAITDDVENNATNHNYFIDIDNNGLDDSTYSLSSISDRNLSISTTDIKLDGTKGTSINFSDYDSGIAIYGDDPSTEDIETRLSTINVKGETRPTGQEHTNFNYTATLDAFFSQDEKTYKNQGSGVWEDSMDATGKQNVIDAKSVFTDSTSWDFGNVFNDDNVMYQGASGNDYVPGVHNVTNISRDITANGNMPTHLEQALDNTSQSLGLSDALNAVSQIANNTGDVADLFTDKDGNDQTFNLNNDYGNVLRRLLTTDLPSVVGSIKRATYTDPGDGAVAQFANKAIDILDFADDKIQTTNAILNHPAAVLATMLREVPALDDDSLINPFIQGGTGKHAINNAPDITDSFGHTTAYNFDKQKYGKDKIVEDLYDGLTSVTNPIRTVGGKDTALVTGVVGMNMDIPDWVLHKSMISSHEGILEEQNNNPDNPWDATLVDRLGSSWDGEENDPTEFDTLRSAGGTHKNAGMDVNSSINAGVIKDYNVNNKGHENDPRYQTSNIYKPGDKADYLLGINVSEASPYTGTSNIDFNNSIFTGDLNNKISDDIGTDDFISHVNRNITNAGSSGFIVENKDSLASYHSLKTGRNITNEDDGLSSLQKAVGKTSFIKSRFNNKDKDTDKELSQWSDSGSSADTDNNLLYTNEETHASKFEDNLVSALGNGTKTEGTEASPIVPAHAVEFMANTGQAEPDAFNNRSEFYSKIADKWSTFATQAMRDLRADNISEKGCGFLYIVNSPSRAINQDNRAYSIPMQFNPEITGESRSSNWATHTAIGRTNEHFIWSNTSSRTIQFKTTYAIIAASGRHTQEKEWFEGETNKIYDGLDWGKYWTADRQSAILDAYRGLLLPKGFADSDMDLTEMDGNRLSPPIITIFFGTDYDSKFTNPDGNEISKSTWIATDLNLDPRLEAGYTNSRNPRMYDISMTLKEVAPNWKSYQTHTQLGLPT